MGEVIIPPLNANAPADTCTMAIDVGTIPDNYPDAGMFIVTVQVHPFDDIGAANRLAEDFRNFLQKRYGIEMEDKTVEIEGEVVPQSVIDQPGKIEGENR
jgi:hypothetical protein